jgi:hypothetical protein
MGKEGGEVVKYRGGMCSRAMGREEVEGVNWY